MTKMEALREVNSSLNEVLKDIETYMFIRNMGTPDIESHGVENMRVWNKIKK